MLRVHLTLAALLALLPGCDRRVPEPPARPTADKTAPVAAPATPAPPGSRRYVRPAVDHLVAIGDLHGDLDVTRKALRLAGAIDGSDRWIGGKLVVVQTGDLIDRGDDDRAVLDLLARLEGEAKQAGGELVLVNGNHELMNVAFDFRYVTPASFTSFADQKGAKIDHPRLADLTPSERGRAAAFAPGGTYARQLAPRPVVAQVGRTVFVHGGVLPEHVTYGIDRLNDEVSAWMLGQRPEPPSAAAGEQGVAWTRAYSNDSRAVDCARLERTLKALDADRMVVGHTPQTHGVSPACDGKVWRIDTGLSHHYGGPLQILDVDREGARVKP